MRFLIALSLCLLVPSEGEAKPSRHGVDAFAGDRWSLVVAQGASARDVTDAMSCPPPHCSRVKVKRKWKKKGPRHERVSAVARSGAVIVPLPRVRPEIDPEQEASLRVIADLLASGKVVKPEPEKPINIFQGFARELERVLPSRSLAGVVAPLADKARDLMASCGSRVISGVRKTYVAGTRRISLHASGRAVDMAGNPSCMYARLRKWPGGVSTDYGRVRHIHISYAPPSRGQRGREWGTRFAHRGGAKRTRYARYHKRHRTHYASAR